MAKSARRVTQTDCQRVTGARCICTISLLRIVNAFHCCGCDPLSRALLIARLTLAHPTNLPNGSFRRRTVNLRA